MLPIEGDRYSLFQSSQQERSFSHISYAAEITDVREGELLQKVKTLLNAHVNDLSQHAAVGVDFFLPAPLSADIVDAYTDLEDQDVVDIVRLWTDYGLGENLETEYEGRTVGHFLRYLTAVRRDDVIHTLRAIPRNLEDPDSVMQLNHIRELAYLLEPEGTDRDVDVHIASMFGEDNSARVWRRIMASDNFVGLSLFGYGIRSQYFYQIINSRQMGIILSDFNGKHTQALQQARTCPREIDEFMDEETTKYFLDVALLGVQIREGATPDPALLLDQRGELDRSKSRWLHYYLADVPTEVFSKEALLSILETDHEDMHQVFFEIIDNRVNVHPDAFVMKYFNEHTFTGDEAAVYIRDAIHAYHGDWNAVTPTLKELLMNALKNRDVSSDKLNSLVLSCVGFYADLPDFIEEQITDLDNNHSFLPLSNLDDEVKSYRVYKVDPVYRVLSEGFSALPGCVSSVLEDQVMSQENKNIIALSVLSALFKSDYLTYFFGGNNPRDFPPPSRDFQEVDGNYWELVHSDIWDIIKRADEDVLQDFVARGLTPLTVRMYHSSSKSRYEIKDVPLRQCIHPELVQIVTAKPVKGKPLKERLRMTKYYDPTNREYEAGRQTKRSTDKIRSKLIPQYNRHGVDLLTQVRLIHSAHMRHYEEILLQDYQAQRLLTNNSVTVDRLAGVVRSKDRFNLDIGLAGNLAVCASPGSTPTLLRNLCDVAERLFPQGHLNPAVDESNVYNVISAFQLYIALIHPFYESNGRTSEDAMYVLWQRRPDLAHLKRFVSGDGSRKGERVEERGTIINNEALYMVRLIGLSLGLTQEEAEGVKGYVNMQQLVHDKTGMSSQDIRNKYLIYYDTILGLRIQAMENLGNLMSNTTVSELAENLANSSQDYKMRDGTRIK